MLLLIRVYERINIYNYCQIKNNNNHRLTVNDNFITIANVK